VRGVRIQSCREARYHKLTGVSSTGESAETEERYNGRKSERGRREREERRCPKYKCPLTEYDHRVSPKREEGVKEFCLSEVKRVFDGILKDRDVLAHFYRILGLTGSILVSLRRLAEMRLAKITKA
jgi:hypothetical protein